MGKEWSKSASLFIVLAVYILATVIGVGVYFMLPLNWWLSLFIADTAATVVVFIFSWIFKNASIYDPYWSVQPLVIVAAFALSGGTGGAGVLALLVITTWCLRLTGNWVYTFHGLGTYEDWRYVMLRRNTGVFYPLINFIGIHYVPTVIVYACTLPAVVLVRENASLNLLSAVLLSLGFVSIYFELSADIAMHKFRKEGKGGFIRTGLWKYSRHPNYLGEITLWWFIGLACVAVFPTKWYLLTGAALNTTLFLSASIPMAEKHQARKDGYREYRKTTRMLLPIKK